MEDAHMMCTQYFCTIYVHNTTTFRGSFSNQDSQFNYTKCPSLHSIISLYVETGKKNEVSRSINGHFMLHPLFGELAQLYMGPLMIDLIQP